MKMSEKGPSERRRLDGPFSNVVSDHNNTKTGSETLST